MIPDVTCIAVIFIFLYNLSTVPSILDKSNFTEGYFVTEGTLPKANFTEGTLPKANFTEGTLPKANFTEGTLPSMLGKF